MKHTGKIGQRQPCAQKSPTREGGRVPWSLGRSWRSRAGEQDGAGRLGKEDKET